MGNSLTIGVDLGGTKLAVGFVDHQGRVDQFSRTPIAEKSPTAIVDLIANQIGKLLEGCDRQGGVARLGIGVAGQIDDLGRTVRFAPNIGWSEVPLAEMVEQKTGISCRLVNDVVAAGYGEWIHGCGQGFRDMVCIFVGTGVGGAIVADGRILRSAGELGHLTIVVGGRLCSCGHHGCLEAYAGGWAIAKQAQERVLADQDAGATLVQMAGSTENIRAKTVVDALRKSDPLSIELINDIGEHLASGVVGVVNALNPKLVVLGGGVIAGYPEWIDKIALYVKEFALPDRSQLVKVAAAKLGHASAVVGAARWATQDLSIAANGTEDPRLDSPIAKSI